MMGYRGVSAVTSCLLLPPAVTAGAPARNCAGRFKRPDEFIFCTDHAEPRPECGTSDGFHNGGVRGAMNLTSYRQGGNRSYSYRQIFRHKIRKGDPFETGGRANILWLDGHVTELFETTGDDFPERWYSGDKPVRR